MNDSDIYGFVVLFFLSCCCCTLILAAGGAAFWFFRRNQSKKPAASGPIEVAFVPKSSVDTPATPVAPEVPVDAETMISRSPFAMPDVSESEQATIVRPMAVPSTPIEADDIRAKVMALNGEDKPYEVQASGYRLAIAPKVITGYLLEVSFDYAEKVARLVETNAVAADPRIKHDVQQVLEANGWSVRE
jgi:hypothetical protein